MGRKGGEVPPCGPFAAIGFPFRFFLPMRQAEIFLDRVRLFVVSADHSVLHVLATLPVF